MKHLVVNPKNAPAFIESLNKKFGGKKVHSLALSQVGRRTLTLHILFNNGLTELRVEWEHETLKIDDREIKGIA